MKEYINDTNFNCTVEEVANKVFEIKALKAIRRLHEQSDRVDCTAGEDLCDWIKKNILCHSDIDEATKHYLVNSAKHCIFTESSCSG